MKQSTMKTRSIKVSSFMNSAFKEFSLYDNVRSIPILFDGMKPSQRKAVYGVQLRGENGAEIQVERLSAQVASATDYHHGTGSMESTIIGMANAYAGTNNMNVFEPIGQFGSRLTKEAAAGRYIFTKFSKNFRKLYRKEDDSILENILVDGDKIEPKFYLPLLPMMLVNGAQGTGTGHACLIMNYHPNDLRDACIKLMAGKKLTKFGLTPWFKDFAGKVERNEETGQVVITGRLEVTNTTTIKISELPVGVYLDQYKAHLDKMEEAGLIKDYVDQSTEDGFDFIVTVPRSTSALDEEELYKKFKLMARDTENFTLWNEHGTLERFDSPEAILERFVTWRLGMYEVRRQKLISDTTNSIEWASSKIRFILFYLKNSKLFRDTGKKDLIQILIDNDFAEYDKLLSMSMWNLTKDKIVELEKELDEFRSYLKSLEADSAKNMYTKELKEFDYAK